jgi:serine/threonine protein kinase
MLSCLRHSSQAVLNDGKEVAVKRLFLNTRQWIDQFFNEVTLIHRVRQKNLVKLLGCSVDGPESMLVYEYYCNRSLDHYVFGIPPLLSLCLLYSDKTINFPLGCFLQKSSLDLV